MIMDLPSRLVASSNGPSCVTGNADDLLVNLRAKRKTRERHRNGNARLQNKIRAEQQEKNQKKSNIDQRQQDKPAEIIFLCPAKLHVPARLTTNERESCREAVSFPDTNLCCGICVHSCLLRR